MAEEIFYHTASTPIGHLTLAAHSKGLLLSSFANEDESLSTSKLPGHCLRRRSFSGSGDYTPAEKHIKRALEALDAYFDGDFDALNTVTVSPRGTIFQKHVWSALRKIPGGATRSYSQLALAVGRPEAARAAGTACKHNPIVLFVPCHRVIGKNRTLTGFNGGLERKAFLLDHEGLRIEGITSERTSLLSPEAVQA